MQRIYITCLSKPAQHGVQSAAVEERIYFMSGAYVLAVQVQASDPEKQRLRLERLLNASFVYLALPELKDVPLAGRGL